nr:MAG: wsv327-like protein [Metapenaeopsis lamellata majanivirus]
MKSKHWDLLLLSECKENLIQKKTDQIYISTALVKFTNILSSISKKKTNQQNREKEKEMVTMVATDALCPFYSQSLSSSFNDVSSMICDCKNHHLNIEKSPLFKYRYYNIATIVDMVSSKIVNPSICDLSHTAINILVDPLNIKRFPILNILNSFEYMAMSMFWKGYNDDDDVESNRDIDDKTEIILKRFERIVSAFGITLILTIREYKYNYEHAEDLILKIMKRIKEFLSFKIDKNCYDIDNNHCRLMINKPPQSIKLILWYFKSKYWPVGDTLSFMGSVYDVILGEDIMFLLNDIIKKEYLDLITVAGGAKVAFKKDTKKDLDNIIRSRQLIFDNFAIYKTRPLYNIWNFLFLMAGMTDKNNSKYLGCSITSGNGRYILTKLLQLDMSVLLMCSICSTNFKEKIKKAFSMFVKFTSKQETSLDNIFRELLERKWETENNNQTHTGIRGARLLLQEKTASIRTKLTDNFKTSFQYQHDMYTFLSFYILYSVSRLEEDCDNCTSILLPDEYSKIENHKSKIAVSEESGANLSLLSQVALWSLRNAIRVGNYTEPYPLINYLSSINTNVDHNFRKILNHPLIKQVSKQNLKYAFGEYRDDYVSKYTLSFPYKLDKDNNNYNDNSNNSIGIMDGLIVMSKSKLEHLKLEDFMNINILPLTEYEMY